MKSKPSFFLLASILLHMAIFTFLLFSEHLLTTTKNKPNIIEISFDNSALEKIKMVNPTSIVDSDSENANNELSENAKFLSEKSNTVKKETRAKTGEKFRNAKKYLQKLEKKLAVKPERKQPQRQPKLFENGFDAYAVMNKKVQNEHVRNNLTNNTSDASTTNDNLANIEDDLMTRLNTKEYKYFGYYSRIKKQLNQWWVPKVQQKFTKMLRQGRNIASEENKVTKLIIILNDVGHLVTVQLLAESGVRDLDDAAVEAFRAAAPFPNPPKGMVDSDGKVKIRWDCVVES